MTDRLDLFFRAHTIPVTPQKEYRSKRRGSQPKDALIFRCVTTGDERQDLLFGAYICAELKGPEWAAKEIGLFCRDGHPEELRVLERSVKDSAYKLGTIEQFRRKVFLKYLKAGALIAAYDAPFEISRIAIKWNKSRKRRRAFSFYFRMFQDKKTGKMRPSGYEPGLSIESLDASKAIYRLIKYKFHDKDAEREEESFWKQLRWFALVEPNEDVLPMRAKLGQREDSDPTLAWNFLTSKQAIWVTGLDAVAAKLMTGKPLKILKAIKVIPHGVQSGLAPVKLHGQLEVDPHRDDLAVRLVQLRASLKTKNPKLAGGLKVAANSAAFGILCQIDVKDLDSPSALRVFSGQTDYSTPPVKVWEQPAEFYSPLIASLVTGGSHLLCAMLECAVREMGGHIAAMDTDSAMIVSTRDGGLVPCAGGLERLEKYHAPGGNAAIRALSFTEVGHIRERFEALNPWRDTLKAPFLKLEEENFSPGGDRQPLYAYCVSAKLYCLFNLDGDRLLVRKPSGHGLGFLQAPYTIAEWRRKTGRKWKENLPPWVFEAWHFILSRELRLPFDGSLGAQSGSCSIVGFLSVDAPATRYL